jgi:hypothetical protein
MNLLVVQWSRPGNPVPPLSKFQLPIFPAGKAVAASSQVHFACYANCSHRINLLVETSQF